MSLREQGPSFLLIEYTALSQLDRALTHITHALAYLRVGVTRCTRTPHAVLSHLALCLKAFSRPCDCHLLV